MSSSLHRAAQAYAAEHEELHTVLRQMSTLRKRKAELGAAVLEAMRGASADECRLPGPDGGRVVRATTAARTPVTKKAIAAYLCAHAGVDAARAERLAEGMYARRASVVTEELQVLRPKPVRETA